MAFRVTRIFPISSVGSVKLEIGMEVLRSPDLLPDPRPFSIATSLLKPDTYN